MEAITVIVYISIYLGLFATTFYILSFISYSKKEREFYADGELPSVSVIIPVVKINIDKFVLTVFYF